MSCPSEATGDGKRHEAAGALRTVVGYNGTMSAEPEGLGRYFGPDYYGEQDENGIDLSLIRANLKLTPLERARRAEWARLAALQMMEYGRKYREDLAGASS